MPQRHAAQENISVVVPVNCPWTRGTLAAHPYARSAGSVTGLPCISERSRPVRPSSSQGRKRLPVKGCPRDLRRRAIVGRPKPAGKRGPGGEGGDGDEAECHEYQRAD